MIIYILQAITIAVSVISLVLGIIATSKDTSKKLFGDIIIKQRVYELSKTRADASDFFTSIDLNVLRVKNVKEDKIYKIIKSKNELISNFKIFYKEDEEIISLINNISNDAIQMVNGKDINLDNYDENVKNLNTMISRYNQANWDSIKKQATGVILHNSDFLKYYDELNIPK